MKSGSVLRGLILAWLAFSSPVAAMTPAEHAQAARTAQIEAIADPANTKKLEAYLRFIPMVRSPEGAQLFVVEGDLLMTRDEVQVHLAQMGERQKANLFEPELIVGTRSGRQDFWRDPASRRLSYAVQRTSFDTEAEYRFVVDSMRRAVRDWEGACTECGISIKHLSEHDEAPAQGAVTFIVRRLDAGGEYIAAAFFPSDPVFKRYLNLDPSFFTTNYDRVGVLRHEIGHILGYKHEHVRDVRGCYRDNKEWKPLTDYDSESVMHYLCGGGGNRKFQLSARDVEGHRKLYAGESGSAALRDSEGMLVLRFEGASASTDVNRAIQLMSRFGVVKGESVRVGYGDRLCPILRQTLHDGQGRVHCTEPDVLFLANQLGRQLPRQVGTPSNVRTVALPTNLEVRPYNFSKLYDTTIKLDADRLKDDLRRMPAVRQPDKLSDGVTRTVFEGLELRVTSASEAASQAFLEAMRRQGFESERVYGNWAPLVLSPSPRHSLSPSDHLQRCRQSFPDPGEGDYLPMLTEEPIAELRTHLAERCPKTCSGSDCVGVMLIDVPVFSNLDIRTAIASGGRKPRAIATSALPSGSPRALCREATFDVNTHHGTHLAGIVASQQNGFGFLGVSPHARLYTFDRDLMRDYQIADLIEERMDPNSKPAHKVFLFASSVGYPAGMSESGFLKRPEDRIAGLMTARKINDIRPIWINSAGNRPRGAQGIDIRENSDLSPMNLGDLANVIVVTACEKCGNNDAKLLPEANYSTRGLVHVAAPGEKVPGLADEDSIAEADGTSQAAALVAGLAAEMLRCYPDHFQRDGSLKRRLQVTSRAAFDVLESDKVKAGIVDAGLALRDPRVHWVKKVGDRRKEVDIAGWCGPTLRLYRTALHAIPGGEIDTKDIRRVTRNPRAAPGNPLPWIIFGDNPTGTAHEVRRVGPGLLAQVKDDAPLLKVATAPGAPAEYLSLGQLEDLTLAKSRLPVVACEGS